MKQDEQMIRLSAKLHRLAIELSDAGMTLNDRSQHAEAIAEVERISNQLQTVRQELRRQFHVKDEYRPLIIHGSLALK